MTENPIKIFQNWYKQVENLNLDEPYAATLATVDENKQPSARIILVKHYDERGFCFFTNTTSRKSKELHNNPKAALCFYWDALSKQVRIEGSIEIVSEKEADDYFASRSRESQIGAWASKQSTKLEHRQELNTRIKDIEKQFAESTVITRPFFWSGYRLVPKTIELWEKGDHRLHTRRLFTKNNDAWEMELLYP